MANQSEEQPTATSTSPKTPTAAPPLPTVEELLQRIESVRTSVLIGAISTQTGAFQVKCLEMLLRYQQKRAEGGPVGAAPPQGLIEHCLEHPEHLNYIAALLPHGALERLLQRLAGGNHDAS